MSRSASELRRSVKRGGDDSPTEDVRNDHRGFCCQIQGFIDVTINRRNQFQVKEKEKHESSWIHLRSLKQKKKDEAPKKQKG